MEQSYVDVDSDVDADNSHNDGGGAGTDDADGGGGGADDADKGCPLEHKTFKKTAAEQLRLIKGSPRLIGD